MPGTLVVTGGGRGIGRATALLAGARGWAVAIGYVADPAAASGAAVEIEAAGGRALAVRCDVSSERDVVGLFDAAAVLGPIRGLVNNAGIVAPASPLAEIAAERLSRMFAVNVLGAFLCAREAARRMGRSGGGAGGAIVNLSSGSARRGAPFEYVDYAASKGAIDTLTIGLAKELAGEGIRVNAVRPGLIDTEIHASGGRPDRARAMAAQIPAGRAGTPGEVAEAILWLLGDSASYTTGAIVDVAGGL